MNTDSELLRRYVETRSEPAFTELVQRYIGLVYSLALRRVGGDAHLAEDVAQQVFSDLARKAAALTDRASLAGWLYAAAHAASAAIVRAEQRRKHRESAAHAMQALSSDSEPDWTRLRPVIDDAIVALKDDDREAIALRFFQRRSFADVGAALRVSEEAARKRVDRALDKLRSILAERGVTSSAAALTVALGVIATTPAPAHLGTRVASEVVARTSVPTSGSVIGGAAGATLTTAAVLVLGTMLVTSQREANGQLRAEIARLSSEQRTVAELGAENRRLARSAAQADELRQISASLPTLRRALAAVPVGTTPATAALTVTPQGTIAWGDEFVKLRDFVERVRALSAASGEAKIVIRAPGAGFSALAYVIDEVRKAGIQHVIVESDATPDHKLGFSWF